MDTLQPATFAINSTSTPSSVTGISAYFLNHGRHPVLPKELPLNLVADAAEHHPREAYAYDYCAPPRIS